MSNKENLLSTSNSKNSIRRDLKNKNYINPRSFDVYEIPLVINAKRFRFGNHPIRENKLIREFENVKRVTLFIDRKDAKAFADF